MDNDNKDNLMHFSPKLHLDAEKNLHEFIGMCRHDLAVFGVDLNWDAIAWPKAANFTKLGVRSRGYKETDQIDPAFIDFAKAYFRYQQGHSPTQTKNESKALRVIEASLLQVRGRADISLLDIASLDEAALLGRNHYSPMAAYHCGRELERLSKFVCEKCLVPTDVSSWKSPIKKPGDSRIQTGAKAKAIQDKKLPSDDAINALAEIFANAPCDPSDIFTSSTFAMTMCAPSRISEILQLPADCEVEEVDADGEMQYGWRFFSGKGFEGDIKWIPQVMVPIAKEAVNRIRALTEESRNLARWIEQYPEKFYRHKNCPNVNDDVLLTAEQAAQALGMVNLASTGLSAANYSHTLNSLWKYVLSRQPDLPWLSKERRIKYSNALFCMSRNMLHRQRGKSPVILWAPENNIFNNDLSPRESLKSEAHKSIFDRHGYTSGDNKRIKVSSHQARHLISTLANRGGLSQESLAKWAGRADPKQNRVYNHQSEWEMVAAAEALDTSLTLFGPQGEVSQHIPVTTLEVNLMERGPVHISLWGVCSHDFIMSPCEKFRDCLNCEEHVCIKGVGGDASARLERIKARLAQVEIDYSAATKALSNGYTGADRWYEYLNKTVERLRQLVEILENPQVPEDAQIKLRDGRDYSHLRRVIRAKAVEALDGASPQATLLSEMTQLLEARHG